MEKERSMTNAEFAGLDHFKLCCSLAKIKPTTRQASKFRNKKGMAYRYRKEALKQEGIG